MQIFYVEVAAFPSVTIGPHGEIPELPPPLTFPSLREAVARARELAAETGEGRRVSHDDGRTLQTVFYAGNGGADEWCIDAAEQRRLERLAVPSVDVTL